MKSKVAEQMMAKMPQDVKIFVDKYADIVVRVNQLLREKRFTQKDLAEKMEKNPSEISKWLGGNHNFTLRSIAKLEAELGETILYVPKRLSFQSISEKKMHFTVKMNDQVKITSDFTPAVSTNVKSENLISNVG
jgi:transcriptional regulator with XRE-family HTH domain